MVYPSIVSDFVYVEKHQTVTNFASAIINTRVKVLINNDHIYTFRNIIIDSLLQHKNYLKSVAREADMKKLHCFKMKIFLYWLR